MTTCRHARVAGTLFALVAIVASTIPSAVAQDATPVAQLAAPARPAHIHSGDCVNLGDVVVPLSDLTAPVSEGVGQADRATPAESSFTTVPMTLDAILGADHAINVHLSAERIDTYIACGELGGIVDPTWGARRRSAGRVRFGLHRNRVPVAGRRRRFYRRIGLHRPRVRRRRLTARRRKIPATDCCRDLST